MTTVHEDQCSSLPQRRLSRTQLLFVLAACAVCAFAFYKTVWTICHQPGDAQFVPRRWVNLAEPNAVSGGEPTPKIPARSLLRVAIAPVISPGESLEEYQAFVDYVARRLGCDPVCLQRRTSVEINDLVRYGRCDMALVGSYPFVRGERDFGMEALVVPQINGAVTCEVLVIVPQSSRANSLSDLRGMRFASADIISHSGWLFPATWLKEHDEKPDQFFAEHLISGGHDRSIEAVVNGRADGAAVNSVVYDQMAKRDPSIARKTRIILRSPPFGVPPMVVSPKMDSGSRKRFLLVLLTVHKEPEGKRILDALGIERFVVPADALYDSVRQEAKIWEAQ